MNKTGWQTFSTACYKYKGKYADIHAVTGIDLPIEFQGSPFFE